MLSLNKINRFAFVEKTQCVSCEIRTELLYNDDTAYNKVHILTLTIPTSQIFTLFRTYLYQDERPKPGNLQSRKMFVPTLKCSVSQNPSPSRSLLLRERK
jgi:hypothetical protein